MKLLIDRAWKKQTYTISRLFIDGTRFYESLEDKDRGLKQTDSLARIATIKVSGETAIPSGIYEIDMDTISPKYAAIDWYKKNCNGGRMPRIKFVPGFDGILIHPGGSNGAIDTRGCILVGRNLQKGKLLQSKEVFKQLYKKLSDAHKRSEKITIEIK